MKYSNLILFFNTFKLKIFKKSIYVLCSNTLLGLKREKKKTKKKAAKKRNVSRDVSEIELPDMDIYLL